MRLLFEPAAPPIAARIDALHRLREAGVRTYVFIGPMLPMNPARLAAVLRGIVDEALVDPMNYPARHGRSSASSRGTLAGPGFHDCGRRRTARTARRTRPGRRLKADAPAGRLPAGAGSDFLDDQLGEVAPRRRLDGLRG